MAAQLTAPQNSMLAPTAHAAIEIHKAVDQEPGTVVCDARRVLADRLRPLRNGPLENREHD